MGVHRARRDADVVPGLGVDPLKPAGLMGEDLVGTGEKVEVLGILMAMQWHYYSRRNYPAQNAWPAVFGGWPAKDFDSRSENVENHTVGLCVDAMKNGGKDLRQRHGGTPFSE
jgi:hypothetical protein